MILFRIFALSASIQISITADPISRPRIVESGYPWSDYVPVGNIRYVDWSEFGDGGAGEGRGVPQSVFKSRIPMIIRGSPVGEWGVSGWHPKKIQTEISTLQNVYIGHDNLFLYFHDDKDDFNQGILSEFSSRGWAPNYYLRNLSTADFFHQCRAFSQGMPPPDNPLYYYYSGDLGIWAESPDSPGITGDFPWEESLEIFGVPEEFRALNKGEKTQEVISWLGCDNVTASPHYDSVHNFFLQVYGAKRFTIFPPEAHLGLHMHPKSHPSWTQAQVVDLNNVNVQKYPLFPTTPSGFDFTLQPGEVLYLPPFWFHRVQSIGMSISLALWTDSKLVDDIDEVFSSPLPFESSWTRTQFLTASAHYISALTQAFTGSKSSARRLLHLFTISRHLHTCPPPPVPPLSEFLGESQDCGVEGISEGLQEKINKYAGVVAQGIRRMKPYGVAEMKLCDFIDDLLNFAVHFKRDAILDTCEVNSVDEECEKVGKKEVNQEKGALVDAQIPELVCWALQSCM